jgi:L-amino acid N-acyltransferase YncA
METRCDIRPTRESDISQVRDIYALEVNTGTSSFELEAPGLDDMMARYKALLDAGYAHLVACRDAEILGFAYTSSYRPRPGYRHTVEDSIYVRSDMRGQGVASALLGQLIADCANKPFRQMIAVIGDSANRSSIGLHEKLGFRTVGVFTNVGYKFERWIDTVLMQREL